MNDNSFIRRSAIPDKPVQTARANLGQHLMRMHSAQFSPNMSQIKLQGPGCATMTLDQRNHLCAVSHITVCQKEHLQHQTRVKTRYLSIKVWALPGDNMHRNHMDKKHYKWNWWTFTVDVVCQCMGLMTATWNKKLSQMLFKRSRDQNKMFWPKILMI